MADIIDLFMGFSQCSHYNQLKGDESKRLGLHMYMSEGFHRSSAIIERPISVGSL